MTCDSQTGCKSGVGILSPLENVKEAATQFPGETVTFGNQGDAVYTMPSRPAAPHRMQQSTHPLPGSHFNAGAPNLNIENEHTGSFSNSASTRRSSNVAYPPNASRTVNPYESFSFPSGNTDVAGGSTSDRATPQTINSSLKRSSSYTSHSSPGNPNDNAQSSSRSPPQDIVSENLATDDFYSAAGVEGFVNVDGPVYPPTPDIDQDFSFLSQATGWLGREGGMTPGASASMDKGDSNGWLGMIEDPSSWGLDGGFVNSLGLDMT